MQSNNLMNIFQMTMQIVNPIDQEIQLNIIDQDEQPKVEFIHGKIVENGVVKYKAKFENNHILESRFMAAEDLKNYQYHIRGFERKMSELIFRVAIFNNAFKQKLLLIDQDAVIEIPSIKSTEQSALQQQAPIQQRQKLNILPLKPFQQQISPESSQDIKNLSQNSYLPQLVTLPNNNLLQKPGLLLQSPPRTIWNAKPKVKKNPLIKKPLLACIESQQQYQGNTSKTFQPILDYNLSQNISLAFQLRDPILDNELTEHQIAERKIISNSLKHGNFQNGDIPLCISGHATLTTLQKALGSKQNLLQSQSQIFFKVEFRARPSGTIPLSSYISFEEIRDKYPKELLSYYLENGFLIDLLPPSETQSNTYSISK